VGSYVGRFVGRAEGVDEGSAVVGLGETVGAGVNLGCSSNGVG
jgi:hypothetical protein